MNEGEIQVVMFKLGDEVFGIDVHQVREIIKAKAYAKVPNAPYFIEGVINLRGQITPIVNIKSLLGIQSENISDNARIVITEVDSENVGLIVDSVLGVNRVPKKDIVTPPRITKGSRNDSIVGIAKVGEQLVILLDVKNLLAEKEPPLITASTESIEVEKMPLSVVTPQDSQENTKRKSRGKKKAEQERQDQHNINVTN